MSDNTVDSLQIEIKAAAGEAAGQIEQLTASLQRLQGSTRQPGLEKVSSQLQKVGKAPSLSRLERELSGLQKAAERDGDALVRLQRHLENLQQYRGIGNPLTNAGVETEIAQTEAEIRRLSASVDGLDAKIRTVRSAIAEGAGSGTGSLQKAADAAQKTAAALAPASNAAAQTEKKLNSASDSARRFGAAVKAAGDGGGGALSKLGGVISKMSLRMAVFSAIHSLVNGAAESIKRMAQENEGVNETLSRIKSSLQYVCDALAATIYPILKAIEPVLTFILDTVAGILNLLARGIAFLTGQDFVLQAKKQMSDFSDSTDDAAGAVKRLKRELLPFDELNIFGDNDSGNGSGLGDLRFEQVSNDLKLPDTIKSPKWEPNPIPAPEFAPVTLPEWSTVTLQSPAWSPAVVPAPAFEPFPVPELAGQKLPSPEWIPSLIEAPAFEPLIFPEWAFSPFPVPEWEVNPVPAPMIDLAPIQNGLAGMEQAFSAAWSGIQVRVAEGVTTVQEKLQSAGQTAAAFASATQASFAAWGENVKTNFSAVMTYISTVTVPALQSSGASIVSYLGSTAEAFAEWGTNVAANFQAVMAYLPGAAAEGLSAAGKSVVDWINATSNSFAAWGGNLIQNGAKAISGFVQNFVSGLSSAWDSFVGFMKATGEKVSSWWSANKSWAAPVGIAALAGVAATAIVLSGGTAGLAAAPAMAKVVLPAMAFANGGVVRSPTLGLVGEYPGAATNPEVIAPQKVLAETIRQETDFSEVINAIFAMGQQIVNAINENGDRPINLDMGKVASGVTTMQNRRNKMYGKQL